MVVTVTAASWPLHVGFVVNGDNEHLHLGHNNRVKLKQDPRLKIRDAPISTHKCIRVCVSECVCVYECRCKIEKLCVTLSKYNKVQGTEKR